MEALPIDPGFYVQDPHVGWLRFEHLADALYYRIQQEPPALVREVSDPAENLI